MKEQLEQIYRRHRGGLYALAVSLTGCPQQAEDAIHAAFERLCRQPSDKTADPTNYVFAAVRNAAIDLHRSQQRHNQVAAGLFNGRVSGMPALEAEAKLLTAERNGLLRDAIADLPDDDREIVVLKAFSHLTFEDIAVVIGRPTATVATRYRRALQTLYQRLKADL